MTIDQDGLAAVIDTAVILGAEVAHPAELEPGGVYHFARPTEYVVEKVDTEAWAARPRRKRGEVQLAETDSLVAYVQRHATPDTMIYVQPEHFTAVALLDDHSANEPGWGTHRAHLKWQATREWLAWKAVNGRHLNQDAFANLVEDQIHTIASPPSAQLLEVAQTISGTVNARVKSQRRLSNGQVQYSYIEEVEGKAGVDGQMTIPTELSLVLKPFHGAAESVVLTARLRHRLTGGEVSFTVLLNQFDEVQREAVQVEIYKIDAGLSGDVGIVIGVPRS